MCAWFRKFADRLAGKTETPKAERDDVRIVAPTKKAAKPTGRMRRVTIGLDFGTSSSKCCYLEEGPRQQFTAVSFRASRGPRLLFETALGYSDGMLTFGADSEEQPGGMTVRSFKMCLLCQARHEAAGDSIHCPRCSPVKPGHFECDGTLVSAEDVSTLYLSVILVETLSAIYRTLGSTAQTTRIQLNAAAPLDQLQEFGSVGEYFERAFFYALRLAESGVPKREWALSEAMACLQQARREAVPEVAMSPTRVFPETHAAITAYTLLPQSEKGLYGIVDVGAGTTDVSFFWLQKDDTTTAAWYYAAGTETVGMDDLDNAILGVLSNAVDPRAAREALDEEELERHATLIRPVKKRVYQHYAGVYQEATELDQRESAWCDKGLAQFKLFLVGGGASCRQMVDRLHQRPPKGTSWASPPERLSVPRKMAVLLPGGKKSTIRDLKLSSDAPLMLLALGLSHRRPDIPEYDRDETGVPRTQSDEQGWSVEEMYGHF